VPRRGPSPPSFSRLCRAARQLHHGGTRLARTACCRAARQAAARPAAHGDGGALLAEARQLLAGTQKIRRPRKRKGLIAVLHSHFSKKVPESELRGLVDKLIARGELSESNDAIAYHF